ncbi:conjugative transposon protein TraN [Spirosoma luteum]|uniref:conjugative transposon protein TraN n=1 Tax=Spirosoma luteum TaxID=431553 RepID=UPI0003801DFE|nr:conjugative transposon protein TraN [Spirosoma luteum]
MKIAVYFFALMMIHPLAQAQGSGSRKRVKKKVKSEIGPLLTQRVGVVNPLIPIRLVKAGPETTGSTLPETQLVAKAEQANEGPPRAFFAGNAIAIGKHNIIRSYYVDLAFNKTTCIIFKTSIRSVDLGSKDIIADKANGVDNVLRVKASSIGFNETNFSVMTADGQFHSFVVNYNEYPTMLALDLSVSEEGLVQQKAQIVNQKGTVVSFAGVNSSQQEIVQNCTRVLEQHRRVKRVGISKYNIQACLRGLYYKDNILYYKIGVKNKSNINYDLDFIRFFIVDKTIAKETSHQELEVSPLYVYNQPLALIPGKESIEKIYAFQKFTIPNDKVVQVVMGEKNGGRTVSFKMDNQALLRADLL